MPVCSIHGYMLNAGLLVLWLWHCGWRSGEPLDTTQDSFPKLRDLRLDMQETESQTGNVFADLVPKGAGGHTQADRV